VHEAWFWPYGQPKNEPSPLLRARYHAGFSQHELADVVGVTRKTIWSLECGQSKPSLQLAQALGLALERPIDELFPLG
jgi:DNA-binding XRE family transcriptional regulator